MKLRRLGSNRPRGLTRFVSLLLGLSLLAGGFGCGRPANNAGVTARGGGSFGAGGGRQTGSFGGGRQDSSASLSPHLALGNPSEAGQDRNNFLIIRDQYALSYNDSTGRPNWVSWHLSADDLGSVERGKFAPDASLPSNFKQVTPKDYTSSGYDRGHNCPSGDRTRTKADNDATFLMTNIMPQAPGNNQGPWKDLEDHCRELARQGQQLAIVCGSSGETGETIGRNQVAVPAMTWKIVVVLPEGKQFPQDVTANSEVIAVVIPNKDSVRNTNWKQYRVRVREIEMKTDYAFLTSLSPSVREALEERGE